MKTLCIDLGHGGNDSGCTNSTSKESNLVLALGKKLNDRLKKTDIKYKFTRLANETLGLQNRCNIANSFKADYFISIHLNSYASNTVRGSESYLYDKKNGYMNVFASNVSYEIANYLQIPNRGVKINQNFTVLKNTTMPACLLELDFLSNDTFRKLIETSQVQDKLVDIIYKQILELCQYQETYYRVCVASFKDYKNAQVALGKVKELFPDAFIV